MSFSVGISAVDSTRTSVTDSGAVFVSVFNERQDCAHIHFATPYEAWKWASDLAYALEQKMNAEVVNG
jgi:hypothetical protein